MEVKIKEGVTWQTEAGAMQSEAATEWLRGEIYPALAMNAEETDKVIPETDRWGRPTRWIVDGAGWRVTVEREYMEANRPTWSRRRDRVTVESADVPTTEKGGEL